MHEDETYDEMTGVVRYVQLATKFVSKNRFMFVDRFCSVSFACI